MIPYDCRPQKWRRPGSQVIIEATESVAGEEGHGSYEAQRVVEHSCSKCQLHGHGFL